MSLGLFNPASLALNNKFLPVHCVVARDECPQRVLQDGFVIVPAHTKFHEIVPVVLRTMEADVGKIEHDERADGQILIKNWNPLPIPAVTENRTVTVQDILGDLMNVAVLKIRISKYINSLEDKRSVSLLKQLMPLVTDDRDKHELVSKLCQVIHEDEDEDDDDGQQQSSLLPHSSTTRNTTSPNGYSSNSSTSNTTDCDLINSDNTPLNLSTKQYSYPSIMASATVSTKPLHRLPLSSHSSAFASLLSLTQQQQQQLDVATAAAALVNSHHHIPSHHFSSSTVKDYAYNRRQRERTTFDPHEETPRLLQIFTDTKHPTRYQIASICESLNALPCRKGKKPLEPYNIQYWFKNARAALKRKKRRFGNGIEAPQQGQVQQAQQSFLSSSPKILSNGGGNHFPSGDDESPAPIKFELDSSDEIDGEPIMPDDEDDDDGDEDEDEDASKFIIDEKHPLTTTSSSSIHKAFNTTSSSTNKSKDESSSSAGNNYYFHYLQAFDISLTDQQKQNKRSKLNVSEEDSADDDEENVSFTSEGSPTQVALPLPLPSPSLFNNNHDNTTNFRHLLSSSSSKSSKLTNANKHPESIVPSYDYNRARRNRIFIDPTSEVPKLEQWFAIETHPDHILIERICTELNEGEYRTKFPKLESKHIRLWFKNHRAKVKRICRIQTPTTVNNETPPPAPPSGQQQS